MDPMHAMYNIRIYRILVYAPIILNKFRVETLCNYYQHQIVEGLLRLVLELGVDTTSIH